MSPPLIERALRLHEAVPGSMGLQPADVQIHLLRQAEALAADLDQLTSRHQRLQVPPECGALFAGDLEQLQELACASRVVHALAHLLEEFVSRQHLASG